MKKQKPLVSVGIAAYNAEKNIAGLLSAVLCQQETNFKVKEIFVHCDSCLDDTSKIAKGTGSEKVVVVDGYKRKGFAGAVRKLLKLLCGDYVVLLNDDIRIKDRQLIAKLVEPLIQNEKIGLVSGHPQPLRPGNFVENAMVSSYRAYDRMRPYINEGDSEYSLDGKVLALSKEFVKKITFPKDYRDMGNVDIYIYFLCISKGFRFKFASDTIVFYKNPANVDDLVKWSVRNNSNKYVLNREFGKVVDREYHVPLILWKYKLIEFVKIPLGCLFIFFISFYINQRSKIYSTDFNPIWEVITSTKKL